MVINTAVFSTTETATSSDTGGSFIGFTVIVAVPTLILLLSGGVTIILGSANV